MIVNDAYKFCFVHLQKTGGTSITYNLGALDGTYLYHYHHGFYQQEEKFRDYFKFCFVRNPWDRLYSWYNMMLKKGIHNSLSAYLMKDNPDFSTFLDRSEVVYEKDSSEWDGHTPYPKSISFNQLDYISDAQGKILVNYIGRFENLASDYQDIQRIIGFSNPLDHLNKFVHKPYREAYRKKDIEKVYRLYQRDIDYFGYEF